MLSNTASSLGKLGYGIFYITPVSYLYLLVTDSIINIPYFASDRMWWIAIGLLIVSIYASIWIHQVALLIYGDRAGPRSSKPNEVRNRHLTFFATGVPPSKLPKTSSQFELMQVAVSSEHMKWGVFIRYIPAALFSVYTALAWLWLTLFFLDGTGDIVTGAFWLTLTILLVRRRITGYLPNYIPEESIPGIDQAEYVRNRRQVNSEIGRKNQRRIEPQQHDKRKRVR